MPAGRPREYDREAIAASFELYISNTPIPIVAEFAALHRLTKQFMYDCEELSDLVKQCTFKKEAALERQALGGAVNCTMAIFSLKQLGWTDKTDQTLRGDAAHPFVLSKTDLAL